MDKSFVVHSFGKCGSRSIQYALQDAGNVVYHCHYIANPSRDDEKILHEAYNMFEPYVIIPIREPIGRNISAYFENYTQYGISVKKFVAIYPHMVPVHWFLTEPPLIWNFDVYREPFNKENGWKVYDSRILIIRMESFYNWGYAFYALTGKEAPPLMMAGKNESIEYLDFLKKPLPKEYIDRMHSTKYYRHFYE